MKDIKTKQKVLSLKTKDEKKNMKHFILQQTIHKKDTAVKTQTKNDEQTGLEVTMRVSHGREIKAACGQLANTYNKAEKQKNKFN